MGVALNWCAAILALLPSLLAGDVLASLDGTARLSFALVPWLLLAGLPRRSPLDWGTALGLALPTLSLAAWLDTRGGTELGDLLARGAWALVCALLIQLAARRARGRVAYGAGWFGAWIALPSLAGLASFLRAGESVAWMDGLLSLGAVSRALVTARDLPLDRLDAAAVVTASVLLWLAGFGRRP